MAILKVVNPAEWMKIRTYMQEIEVDGSKKDLRFLDSVQKKFIDEGSIKDYELSKLMSVYMAMKDRVTKKVERAEAKEKAAPKTLDLSGKKKKKVDDLITDELLSQIKKNQIKKEK